CAPEGAPPMAADHPIFSSASPFATELKTRVNAYFEQSGLSQRDQPRMFAKTALIMAWLVGSYAALYLATNAWEVVVLAVSLGLAMAGLGFDIQHDGGHAAYSKHEWINVAAAHTLDLIGGSSYVWHWKHNEIGRAHV